jgi:CheY-like chemotaxis protein
VRAGAADMLVDLGYKVEEAGSGAQALEKLRSGPRPDLLITDYLMPNMNGADLAAEARRAHPDLPILLISGYTNLEAGSGDLPRLMKPFRQEELAAKVAALLKSLSP